MGSKSSKEYGVNKDFSHSTRMLLLFRAQNRCSYCNKKINVKNFHADHIIPKGYGPNTAVNGAAVCQNCKISKGVLTLKDWNSRVNYSVTLCQSVIVVNREGKRCCNLADWGQNSVFCYNHIKSWSFGCFKCGLPTKSQKYNICASCSK